ncbi:MAG: hypothetical protein NVSMB16_14670 [Acidimicrobiales bacterium]
MRRYLVVGSETLGGSELLAGLVERAERSPSLFHLVVPMTHPSGAWSEGGAHAVAESRMVAAIRRFEDAGLVVTAEVGDASPVAAVSDALLANGDVAEIIVSTHPPGLSAWLNNNVVRRIAHEHPTIPVAHVVPAPAEVG